MTKTELMENYTAEQLADMVLYGEQIGEKLMDVITGGNKEIPVIFDKISRAETKGLEGENHKKTLIEKCQEEIGEWKKNHPYNTDERLEAQKLIKEIRKDENGIWLNMKDADFIQNYSKMQKTISDNQSEIAKLNCEVEKCHKAFEDAKKERDCQVAEYRKKIEELENHHKFCMMQIDDVLVEFLGVTHEVMDKPHDFEMVLQELIDKNKTELERAKNTINQIDYILEKLFGVRYDTVDKPDEFEKILHERIKGNVTDFLPTEPIKVADVLMNAEGEYERNPLEKEFCGTDKGTYRIFEVSELRQIAEHLLVYCNHNKEEV